jgi:ribosome-associated heat shock protein Hsp15
VTERRGPPRDAQLLYDETAEGRATRERLAEAHKIAPAPTYRGKGRPTKKQRREIERLEEDGF